MQMKITRFFLSFQIWLNFLKCFNYPLKDITVKLAIVWLTLSFG